MKLTQTDQVKVYLEDKSQATIKQIAEEIGILEPNVRRILGVGEKNGEFERVSRGIYKIKVDGKDILSLYNSCALEKLPELIEQGLKVDLIFLDIPYHTKATRGGSRGVKYDTISVEQFDKMLFYCDKLLKSQESKIIFMFSNAKSGLSDMEKYLDVFHKYGYNTVCSGKYQKLFNNGKPVRNMTGNVSEPEGINVYSKSQMVLDHDLNYECVRVHKGYQTEKNIDFINDIIRKLTNENDIILDPCAGSGVVGISSIINKRISILIEKSETAIKYICDRIIKEFGTNNIPKFQF